MTEKKGKRGRPRKFQSVKELQKKIDAHFVECDEKKKFYTITGLAIALETTRKTLLDYEAKDDEFSDVIKMAKARCEECAENRLFGSQQCTGAIFTLKNNFGWRDVKEEKGSHNISIQIIDRFRLPEPAPGVELDSNGRAKNAAG